MHALAGIGLALASPAPLWTGVAALVLAAHGRARSPPAVPALVREPGGGWGVPDLGRSGLGLGPGCRDGGWWIRLVLVDGRRRWRWLLLRDQLEPQAWEALRAEIRRSRGVT